MWIAIAQYEGPERRGEALYRRPSARGKIPRCLRPIPLRPRRQLESPSGHLLKAPYFRHLGRQASPLDGGSALRRPLAVDSGIGAPSFRAWPRLGPAPPLPDRDTGETAEPGWSKAY